MSPFVEYGTGDANQDYYQDEQYKSDHSLRTLWDNDFAILVIGICDELLVVGVLQAGRG